MICSSRNITEQKQYEKSILYDKEKAENASKAKSDFLANMSHEIRTPMNGILGFLQLLEMTEMDQQQSEYVDLIRSSTRILLQTINDILDVSKIEAGKFSIEYIATNLNMLLDETIHMFKPLVEEKNIDFLVTIDENTPEFIITDPLRLKQVFNNLLSNAIKFTDEGSIEFSVKIDEKTSMHHMLMVSVKDTGVGISTERANKLFDAFEQEDLSVTRKYGGTGLGLAISKTIVSALKGQITFESVKGEGTTFKIELPVTVGNVNVESADSHKLSNLDYDHSEIEPVLVVEDSAINQKFITTVLKDNGYAYDVAYNGLEAFEKSQIKKYSMILMDCQMPIMDGYTSAKKIKCIELNKFTPIIAMTAYALEGDRLKCLESGMIEYISKPLPIHEIIDIVEKYVQKNPD